MLTATCPLLLAQWLGEVGGWCGWSGVRAPANNTPCSDSIEVIWHIYSTNHRALQQRKNRWQKGYTVITLYSKGLALLCCTSTLAQCSMHDKMTKWQKRPLNTSYQQSLPERMSRISSGQCGKTGLLLPNSGALNLHIIWLPLTYGATCCYWTVLQIQPLSIPKENNPGCDEL